MGRDCAWRWWSWPCKKCLKVAHGFLVHDGRYLTRFVTVVLNTKSRS